MVNGPEGHLLDEDTVDWDFIDWRTCEEEVQRLRGRIFKAAQEGDWPKVRNLQKLMLRSRSNTLVSVRQVAQRNAGRVTAGIDGQVSCPPQQCGGPTRRASAPRDPRLMLEVFHINELEGPCE